MVNENTRQLMIDAAEKKCTCVSCMKAKAEKKALKVSQELPSKIVKPMPSNFIQDLSPHPMYWKLGRRG